MMREALKKDPPQLREFESLSPILRHVPRKEMLRLFTNTQVRVTCMDASADHLVLATNVGSVHLYERQWDAMHKLFFKKGDAISSVKMQRSLELVIAAGFEDGSIIIYVIPIKDRIVLNSASQYSVTSIHNAPVSTLCWSFNCEKLFSGDKKGVVVCSQLNTALKEVASFKVSEERGEIVQLSYAHQRLLISTTERSAIHHTVTMNDLQVGNQPRKGSGEYGGVYMPRQCRPENAVLYVSRPGKKLWCVDILGAVKKTLIFPGETLFTTENTIPVIPSVLSNVTSPAIEELYTSANEFQFGCLLPFGEHLLVTWSLEGLLLLNPEEGHVVASCCRLGRIRQAVSVPTTDKYHGEVFVLRDDAGESTPVVVRLATRPLQMTNILVTPGNAVTDLVPGAGSERVERTQTISSYVDERTNQDKKPRSQSVPVESSVVHKGGERDGDKGEEKDHDSDRESNLMRLPWGKLDLRLAERFGNMRALKGDMMFEMDEAEEGVEEAVEVTEEGLKIVYPSHHDDHHSLPTAAVASTQSATDSGPTSYTLNSIISTLGLPQATVATETTPSPVILAPPSAEPDQEITKPFVVQTEEKVKRRTPPTRRCVQIEDEDMRSKRLPAHHSLPLNERLAAVRCDVTEPMVTSSADVTEDEEEDDRTHIFTPQGEMEESSLCDNTPLQSMCPNQYHVTIEGSYDASASIEAPKEVRGPSILEEILQIDQPSGSVGRKAEFGERHPDDAKWDIHVPKTVSSAGPETALSRLQYDDAESAQRKTVKSPKVTDIYKLGHGSRPRSPSPLRLLVEPTPPVVQSQSTALTEEVLSTTDQWMLYRAPARLTSLSSSEHALYATDTRGLVYCVAVGADKRLGLQEWNQVSKSVSADWISVSPTGRIIWRLHRGSVYVYHGKISQDQPLQLDTKPVSGRTPIWEEMLYSTRWIDVDSDSAVYVTHKGDIKVQHGLGPGRPYYRSFSTRCPGLALQASIRKGVVWAVVAPGGSKDVSRSLFCMCVPALAKTISEVPWSEVPLPAIFPNSACIASVFLGEQDTAWLLTHDSRLYFISDVNRENPTGSGGWFQISLHFGGDQSLTEGGGGAFGQLHSAFGRMFSAAGVVDVTGSSGNVGGGGGWLVCPKSGPNGGGLWCYCGDREVVCECRGALLGHSWREYVPRGMAAVSKWKHIVAVSVGGVVHLWCVHAPSGEIFCHWGEGRFRSVPLTSDSGAVIMLTVCDRSVWVLTATGLVYVRQGILPTCPLGSRWHRMRDPNLLPSRLVHLSCGGDSVWSVDGEGRVFSRDDVDGSGDVHHHRRSYTEQTSALGAWQEMSLDEKPPSTQLCAVYPPPPSSKLGLWAVDTKGWVYARCPDASTGDLVWNYIPGPRATALYLSTEQVWMLEERTGEAYVRCRIRPPDKPQGDFWLHIPSPQGGLQELAVAPDNTLMATGANGQLLRHSWQSITLGSGASGMLCGAESGDKFVEDAPTSPVSQEDDWELVDDDF